MTEAKYTPEALPEKPEGWTKQMSMHLNFGSEGGCASYTVSDPAGRRTPIGYQYDTRKGGLTGFTHPQDDGVMTWLELRARWAELCAKAKGEQA